jgi:two-component system KDP operon response regulator KdpE
MAFCVCANWTLKVLSHLDSGVVRTVDGDICLTPMEYCVLKHLAAHRNLPVPHRELAQTLWGVYSGKGVHSLRCFIRSLRKKREVDPAHPQYIITVTGVGYCLQPYGYCLQP